MGKVANAIDNKLRTEFAPVRLAVEDESSRHHGHSGYRLMAHGARHCARRGRSGPKAPEIALNVCGWSHNRNVFLTRC